MKKIILLPLICAAAFCALTSCGGKDSSSSAKTTSASTTEAKETPDKFEPNLYAENIFKAANFTHNDLVEQKGYTLANGVICSDKSKNCVPADFPEDDFYKLLEEHMQGISEYDYVLIFDNMSMGAAVCAEGYDNGIAGKHIFAMGSIDYTEKYGLDSCADLNAAAEKLTGIASEQMKQK
jgi:hypothetical protein